jgi:hypothetical protein
VSAYIERESALQAAAQARQEREMRGAWLQLLRGLMVRQQLADDYGGAGEAAAEEVDGDASRAASSGKPGRGRQARKRVRGEPEEEEDGRSHAIVSQREVVMQRLLAEASGDVQPLPGAAAADVGQLDAEEI